VLEVDNALTRLASTGTDLVRAGKLNEASQQFKTVLAMHKEQVRRAPQVATARREMAYTLKSIGLTSTKIGDTAAGLSGIRRGLKIREEYAKANSADMEALDDEAPARPTMRTFTQTRH
jgi:hypothetical protein